ncbi:PAS domain S-box protein [Variovorax sp. J22P168]|uniref:sensor histidine kinase n=1 Tax=Variovorax jilinensis TaxID=3053513 RepID=UPI0025767A65|nr:ATP-binding protein [Variovorax sp. J22P168]MDM0012583.1 PAS domain S-box protein [Variovorax sp. J22P168]
METPVLAPPASDPLWQHQLGLLLESTGEGIFGIDLDGHCMFINRAGAQMLDHAPTAVLGRNMHELTHHSHPDGSHYADTDCPIFNAFRRGLPCRIDTEVFWRRDGSAFAVEYSSHPILDGGVVRGAVITFVDITERRRQALALQQAKEELGLRVDERTRELSDALAQLRELSAWLDKVREDERTRIAREVHDELGSLLVALKMDVDWIGKRLGEQQERTPEAAQGMRTLMRSKCHNMSGLIERAVDNVGRIITDLRPSILDHQGLWAALEWQAHEFVQSAELVLDWQMAVDPALELPEQAAIAVFRIFQEMLSNVGRHARAAHLEVRIETGADGLLRIAVRDDGVGAPARAFEAGTAYGVLGMRERARHFGGRIDIDSAPGAGTLLRLALPLTQP